MDIRNMRTRTEAINALPTVPSALKQISAMFEKPRLSIDELSGFISGDPALTSKILKMVNSAAYGFPNRISSISHAIMLLGFNVVRGLLLGVSVFDLMQKNIAGLWEHSVGCAVAARCIAQKKNLQEPEEVSICGLLHDIGKVILILHYPREYETVLAKARDEGISLFEAEQSRFEATHADVGSWLARKWRFPVNLAEAIEYHHTPHLSRQAKLETAIVHVSDILVRARGIGINGDMLVPDIHPESWTLLQLTDDDVRDILAELETAASEAEDL
ncbi:MAG TPA: HDOD domain-containing protein [Deltaproteobacteria bacterium]|nr:HDOD domain-containing protein [Deltaproteobacteria bacterium]